MKMRMSSSVRRRLLPVLLFPLMIGPLAGCDIVHGGMGSVEETAQWHKTYTLDANGRLELNNVNGKITVEPSTGNTVDITALKKARAGSPEAAKAALERTSINEVASPGSIRIDTKMAKLEGIVLNSGSVQVEYQVRVPAGAEVKFTNVNGEINKRRLEGRLNGGGGRIQIEGTNGGITLSGR